jgi:hypothetical protein
MINTKSVLIINPNIYSLISAELLPVKEID